MTAYSDKAVGLANVKINGIGVKRTSVPEAARTFFLMEVYLWGCCLVSSLL
jgi:hypothetical protein